MPTALQQTDLYAPSASTLAAYRNLFAPPPAQHNTVMVSSATSSLMSAAVKPAAQHLYRKSLPCVNSYPTNATLVCVLSDVTAAVILSVWDRYLGGRSIDRRESLHDGISVVWTCLLPC